MREPRFNPSAVSFSFTIIFTFAMGRHMIIKGSVARSHVHCTELYNWIMAEELCPEQLEATSKVLKRLVWERFT